MCYQDSISSKGLNGFSPCTCFYVLSRNDIYNASATSVLGNIIKIDLDLNIPILNKELKKSFKEMLRVFLEKHQRSQWNRSSSPLSLLVLESNENLEQSANGWMDRFESAQHPSHAVFYTDWDCFKSLPIPAPFHKWSTPKVRMDSWYLILRLTKAYTNATNSIQ